MTGRKSLMVKYQSAVHDIAQNHAVRKDQLNLQLLAKFDHLKAVVVLAKLEYQEYQKEFMKAMSLLIPVQTIPQDSGRVSSE